MIARGRVDKSPQAACCKTDAGIEDKHAEIGRIAPEAVNAACQERPHGSECKEPV